MQKWQKIITQITNDIRNRKNSTEIDLEHDVFAINDNFDAGELLGYYYSFLGNGRKI